MVDEGCFEGTATADAGGTVVNADRPKAAAGVGLLFSDRGCDAARTCAWLIKSAVELVCPSDAGPAARDRPSRSFSVPDKNSASGGAFPRDGGRCSKVVLLVVVVARELRAKVADAGLRGTKSAQRSASGSPSTVDD